jgi:hypothetical protein
VHLIVEITELLGSGMCLEKVCARGDETVLVEDERNVLLLPRNIHAKRKRIFQNFL